MDENKMKKLYGFILLISFSANAGQDMKSEQFTNDWFGNVKKIWDPYVKSFKDQPNKRCLEVGSYEGRSTLYMAKNLCNGSGSYIDAVDTWKGGLDQKKEPLEGLYERFTHNLSQEIQKNQVKINKGSSFDILMNMVQEVKSGKREKYDFIYIDGSHVAKDVLIDTILAWELLKINGIMIFDDYGYAYGGGAWPEYFVPRTAIDAFLKCYETAYEILLKEYQVHIKKLKDEPDDPTLSDNQQALHKKKKSLWDEVINYFNFFNIK